MDTKQLALTAAKARLLAHEGVDMRRLHMPQTGTAL